MSKDTFLFFLVVAASLALCVTVRFPQWGPSNPRAAFVHAAVTFGVSFALAPTMAFVSGGGRAVVAVFAVALPALIYMFLAGIWPVRVANDAVPR